MKKTLLLILSLAFILYLASHYYLTNDYDTKSQTQVNNARKEFIASYQITLDTQRAYFSTIFELLSSNKHFLESLYLSSQNDTQTIQALESNPLLKNLIDKHSLDSINIYLADGTHFLGLGVHKNNTLPVGIKYSEGINPQNGLYQYFHPLFYDNKFIATIEFSLNFETIIKKIERFSDQSDDFLIILNNQNQIQSVENRLKKIHPEISEHITEHLKTSSAQTVAHKHFLIFSLLLQDTLGEQSAAVLHVQRNPIIESYCEQHEKNILTMIVGSLIFILVIILVILQKKQRQTVDNKELELYKMQIHSKDLLDENAFLMTLLETIPLPIFLRDLNYNYTMCNDKFAELLGQEKSKIIGQNITSILSPENVQNEKKADNYLKAIGKSISYEIYDYYNDQKTYLSYKNIVKSGEKIIGTLVILQDTTQQKESKDKLQEILQENEKQKLLLEHDNSIINRYALFFKLDEFNHIIEASDAFFDTLGYTKAQVINREVGEFCTLGSIGFSAPKDEGQDSRSVITFRRKDGNLVWLECSITENKNPLEVETKLIIFCSDLSNEVRIKELSNIDDLTKIYNRKKLNETLLTTLESAKNGIFKTASFVLFDIDDFKNVNDTYGHLVGDSVLTDIANIAQECITKLDIIARWGGEEFAIILPDASMQEALKCTEKIRSAISLYNFDKVGTLTCSFGVTEFKEDDTQDSLIKRADDALYASKNGGKNCIQFVG